MLYLLFTSVIIDNMTIQEWLDDATDKLKKHKIPSARLDSLVLLEYVLVTPRVTLLSHPETDLPATTLVKLNAALAQRLDDIPVAYITNKKEFYGRDFLVNEHVLIPRPETERMIELVKNLAIEAPTIADIGTGSGCIAITLALEIPDSSVVATDISPDALIVAKNNAKHLGAQVTFKYSDLLEAVASRTFDVVCANLPYVPESLVSSPEITKEPANALFSGIDGLDHYHRLFIEAAEHADPPRYIVTEALESQHKVLKKLAALAGYQLLRTDILVQLFIRN
jgi:release factor glutamine methyltransferase